MLPYDCFCQKKITFVDCQTSKNLNKLIGKIINVYAMSNQDNMKIYFTMYLRYSFSNNVYFFSGRQSWGSTWCKWTVKGTFRNWCLKVCLWDLKYLSPIREIIFDLHGSIFIRKERKCNKARRGQQKIKNWYIRKLCVLSWLYKLVATHAGDGNPVLLVLILPLLLHSTSCTSSMYQ